MFLTHISKKWYSNYVAKITIIVNANILSGSFHTILRSEITAFYHLSFGILITYPEKYTNIFIL